MGCFKRKKRPLYTRDDLDRAVSQIDTSTTIIVKLDPSRNETFAQYLEALEEEEEEEEERRRSVCEERRGSKDIEATLAESSQSGALNHEALYDKIQSDKISELSQKKRRLSTESNFSVESFPDDEETTKKKTTKRKTVVRFLSFLDMRSSTMRASMASWRSSIASRRKSDSNLFSGSFIDRGGHGQRSIRKPMRESLKIFKFWKAKKNQKVSPET
ncbi:hypothetical protein HOP50_06g42980 [Chloropicon primus]|nr:hypothetical protein HOP50_06g42980 [Chloropicon primus]